MIRGAGPSITSFKQRGANPCGQPPASFPAAPRAAIYGSIEVMQIDFVDAGDGVILASDLPLFRNRSRTAGATPREIPCVPTQSREVKRNRPA